MEGEVAAGGVLVELLVEGVLVLLPATLPVLEEGAVELLEPDCGIVLLLAEPVCSWEVVELADSPLALGVVEAAPAVAEALLGLALDAASTFSLSFTFFTPGMASAACTARLRSSSEATLPFSLTSPLSLALTSMLENAGSVPSWSFTLVSRALASTFVLSASVWGVC